MIESKQTQKGRNFCLKVEIRPDLIIRNLIGKIVSFITDRYERTPQGNLRQRKERYAEDKPRTSTSVLAIEISLDTNSKTTLIETVKAS